MRAILKENTRNYISLESLINVDFGKKYKLPVAMCHLIGYQMKVHWRNNCTVFNTKDQSSKVSAFFNILTG